MKNKFISDESGITVTVETIILFGISIIFLLMIVQTFQGLNQKQTKIMLQEEFMTIGNNIAKKMSEMNLEAKSSLSGSGSNITIKTELWLPAEIAGYTYTVKLSNSKVILESSSDPYVTVEVPINSDIYIAENSKIYSSDYKYVLQKDPQSCTIFFLNGGVEPMHDNNAPTISINSPPNGSIISKTISINVTVWDDVGVTRVEYFVNGVYKYTAKNPYNWTWDTRTMLNGTYNVTAIAYDCRGNRKPVTRSYIISNIQTFPPEITVISPFDGEVTNFTKPVIKAQISDNMGIDFSSILLKIDGNIIANLTYSNVSQKLTTITYTPSQNLNISDHNLSLYVKDIEGYDNLTNWSFKIEDITTDSDNPIGSIDFPITNASLVPGNFITVSFSASDMNSGLDNLSINVTPNVGVSSIYNETVSKYPDVIKTTSKTWEFADKYIEGMTYTYNITVFDRRGNKGFAIGLPLTVGPGQASQLEVDTSQKNSNKKTLEKIKIRDNVSDLKPVIITGVNVSWSGSGQIEKVKFGGTDYWKSNGAGSPDGSQSSGTKLTFDSAYQAKNTFENMEITLDEDVKNKTFTIVFYLSDTTTKTVTLTAPP